MMRVEPACAFLASGLADVDAEGAAARSPGAPAAERRLDAGLLWIVAALLAAAALAGGSTRPVLWLAWSALLLVLAALRVLIRRQGGPPPAVDAGWVSGAMMALFLAGAAGQMLPMPPSLLFSWTQGEPISVAPSATLAGVLRGAGCLALFGLARAIGSRPHLGGRLAWFMVLTAGGQALWGLAALRMPGEAAFWAAKTVYAGQITGSFVSRNGVAAYLGMGFNLALAMALCGCRRRPAEAMLLFSLALVMMLALAGTGSRMGVISTLAGGVVVLAVSARERAAPPRRGRRAERAPGGGARRLRVALPGFAAIVIVAQLAGGPLMERFLAAPAGLGDRLELWRQSLLLVARRPWTGHGLDSFALVFEQQHAPPLSPALVWDYPHSTYLTLWVEAGVIWGSLPILAALVLAAGLLARLARAGRAAPLPLAGLAILVQAALHATVDFSFEIPANALVMSAILGLAAASVGGRNGKDRRHG